MAHRAASSPAASVQIFQALVARELVEGMGTSLRRTAELLGIAPSAISQYLSGKRLSAEFSRYESEERARRIARNVAERLSSESGGAEERTRALLEGASALAALGSGSPAGVVHGILPSTSRLSPGAQRQLVRWLRRRVRAEQAAVSECMHLAQRARDELTRAVFRQIASDSLRHAEIVASLAAYVERGVLQTPPTGVTRADILHLIAAEERAEAGGLPPELEHLEGTMAVLLASMGSDERKHDEILRRLLELEASAGGRGPTGRHARRPARLANGGRGPP